MTALTVKLPTIVLDYDGHIDCANALLGYRFAWLSRVDAIAVGLSAGELDGELLAAPQDHPDMTPEIWAASENIRARRRAAEAD